MLSLCLRRLSGLQVRLIHIESGSVVYSDNAHTDYVRACRFYNGAGEQSHEKQYCTPLLPPLRVLTHACFSLADGFKFVTSGRDGTLRIFDTESGQQMYHIDLGSQANVAWLDVAIHDQSVRYWIGVSAMHWWT